MGGGDYKDYMKSIDYLLETRKYVDPERLGTWGHSYGGFMSCWIITQTDRFKAVVSMDPVVSMVHSYVTDSPCWLDVLLKDGSVITLDPATAGVPFRIYLPSIRRN